MLSEDMLQSVGSAHSRAAFAVASQNSSALTFVLDTEVKLLKGPLLN